MTQQAVTPLPRIEKSWPQQVFDKQKAASLKNPYPSIETRAKWLKDLEDILVNNQQAIAEAIAKDFGHRSHHETKLAELFISVDGLKDARKNLKKWAKPQKRKVSIWFAGGRNQVLPQPKGVVGVIAPWNYPLMLVCGPVTSALAAGNRCMVKMAANSKNLAELLAKLIAERFDEDTLAILPGVSASDFTPLPYDHLVFTGSPSVGKTIMKTAAENLTPVTLELGGKSPTIVTEDFDIKLAAQRILQGKFLNAGQTCVAPDYLFLPENKVTDFIEYAKGIIQSRYPTLATKDYTSIIDQRAYDRLIATMEDAKAKGAELICLSSDKALDAENQRIAPHIAVNVDESMIIMQDEIFGPLLPIKTYKHITEVINYINSNERPLALYLYSNEQKTQDHIIKNTLSGGVTLNDCVFHVAQHDMPFGGVGNSGMGHYHGQEGFVELSKMRPIFKQSRFAGSALLAPPYGKLYNTMMKLMIGK